MGDVQLNQTEISDLEEVLEFAAFGGGHSVTDERAEELLEKLDELKEDAPYGV